ncbi:molybdenum cofactor synthesis domain-containing protein [Halarchaeum sp. P4]|uniref:MogA/MoaB family molybdenum cofactor biosynthesis protein n=1 Tax=Halarchaeum sp. P4 TaxID=3421639 RepID=UPI003EBEAADF
MVDFQSRDSRLAAGDDSDEGDKQASEGEENGGHDEHADRDGHDAAEHGHDHHAHDVESVAVGVVTVSSSRTEDDDPSGDAIVSLLAEAGHEVVTRELVPDALDEVQGTVDRIVRRDDVDAVVTTGGTGVTPDDVTVEAVRPLCDKRLPGFGELFRRFSYDDIGTRVVGTRAEAGVANGVPVFSLPGSEDAVRLGVSEVILPEISHLVGLATRPEEDEPDTESTGSDAEDGDDTVGGEQSGEE